MLPLNEPTLPLPLPLPLPEPTFMLPLLTPLLLPTLPFPFPLPFPPLAEVTPAATSPSWSSLRLTGAAIAIDEVISPMAVAVSKIEFTVLLRFLVNAATLVATPTLANDGHFSADISPSRLCRSWPGPPD